jgi:hypothetical protein
VAKFWAARLKNCPENIFAAEKIRGLKMSGLESGPIPNFIMAA